MNAGTEFKNVFENNDRPGDITEKNSVVLGRYTNHAGLLCGSFEE